MKLKAKKTLAVVAVVAGVGALIALFVNRRRQVTAQSVAASVIPGTTQYNAILNKAVQQAAMSSYVRTNYGS